MKKLGKSAENANLPRIPIKTQGFLLKLESIIVLEADGLYDAHVRVALRLTKNIIHMCWQTTWYIRLPMHRQQFTYMDVFVSYRGRHFWPDSIHFFAGFAMFFFGFCYVFNRKIVFPIKNRFGGQKNFIFSYMFNF